MLRCRKIPRERRVRTAFVSHLRVESSGTVSPADDHLPAGAQVTLRWMRNGCAWEAGRTYPTVWPWPAKGKVSKVRTDTFMTRSHQAPANRAWTIRGGTVYRAILGPGEWPLPVKQITGTVQVRAWRKMWRNFGVHPFLRASKLSQTSSSRVHDKFLPNHKPALINTPLQRGVQRPRRLRNRFNGFE
jgi:hypothetical protein